MRALRLFAFVAMGWVCTALSAAAQTTAAPTFSIPGGTYNSVETLMFTDATPGAVIYYTVNATTPTTSSTQYTGPITLKETRTIEAMAIAPGDTQSTPVSQSYAFAALAPTISPNGGVFTTPQTVTLATTPGIKIFYTTNGATPTSSSTPYTVPFTVSKSETVKAISEQTYFTSSPVVAAAFTFDTTASPTLSPGPGTYPINQKVTISDATPGATIYYTVDGSTPKSTSTKYTGPITIATPRTISVIAIAKATSSSVTTAHYTLTTATPVLSPVSFDSLTTRSVTMSDSTSGAAIYYTIDGSAPTASSTHYTGQIAVDATANLHAVAIAPAYAPSAVANGVYIEEKVYTVAGIGPYLRQGDSGDIGDGGPPVGASMDSYGIVFDKEGNLYIADRSANRIRKVSVSTGLISTIAGSGPFGLWTGGFSGDGGLATKARLFFPIGIAFDSKNNLYFSDSMNGRVRKIAADTGIITTVAGGGGTLSDSGPATEVELYNPGGLLIDDDDNLYIADTNNCMVRKVSPTTGMLTTITGYVYSPQFPMDPFRCSYTGDGGPASAATIGPVSGIAFDSQKNLYIADSTDNIIRVISASTGDISTLPAFSGNPFGNVRYFSLDSVAVDAAGDVFFTGLYDGYIYKAPAGSQQFTTFLGGGSENFYGDGIPRTQATILQPVALTFDSAGNLYYSQSNEDYDGVRKISLSATPTKLF